MATTKSDHLEVERSNDFHQEKHEVEAALDDDPVYSYAEQRKIIHRLDKRLITVAGIIYMNSLMDRSNLPNAAIAGMTEDLQLGVGFRYVRLSKRRRSLQFY